MAEASPSRDSKPSFIQVRDFTNPAKDKAVHGFFGRAGGVSGGIYSGLNCGVGSSDNPEHVKANREAVAAMMDVKPENILSLYQVHGSMCLKVVEPHKDRPQADAQVTDVPGLALSVLTADCAPVLFYGRGKNNKPVIGAAHAGWKGAFGGILEATVFGMEDYGVKAQDIRAAIGPCIGKRSYEVGREFAEVFLKEDPANERFFLDGQKGQLFDLAGYCASRLYNLGLKNVSITGQDTFANEAEYYSFRRATHRKEPDYGRQISVIALL